MDFIKGAMIGIVAGTVIGVMNDNNIMHMIGQGKKEIKNLKRKYNF